MSRARRRAGGTIAATAAVLLAACERTAEITAPTAAAVPAAVAGLEGHLDPSALAALSALTACEASAFPSVVAGDRLGGGAGSVIVAAGPTTSTSGTPMYDIGSPVPGARATAVDINDGGVVAANVVVGPDTSAYVWTQVGSFTKIPALAGATQMVATDISDNSPAVVVGYAWLADGSVRSWRYTGGAPIEITGGPASLRVRGINDLGQMTGSAGLGAATAAVRYDGATWQTLAPAPSAGWAINALGAVAGYVGTGPSQRATFWAAGSLVGQDLGVLPGTHASQAFALNDVNEVVGASYVLGGPAGPSPRAFYWSSGTGMVQVGGGAFSVPSSARDINNARVVVGFASFTGTGGGTHAWAWTAPGGPIVDLGKRTDACSSFAYGINEVCKIVGHNLINATGQPQDLARWEYACPPRFSLGDRVWVDVNANGAQDAGEPGINGATVAIHNSSGVLVGTATTAGDGLYGFSNLVADSYRVCVTGGVPANHTQTYDLTAPTNDNCATASVGPSRTDVDFGYAPPRFSLGDLVWYDVNGNGASTPDAGEPGIAGVKVTIAGPGGYSATTTTNAGGIYGFGGLLAGTYTVCVDASNMAAGGPLAGHAQTYDLDGTATAHCATASVGPSRTDVDFSYTKGTGTIGNFAWIDANGNGRQDAGEPGLGGVTLTLGGAATGTQTTTGTGAYLFTGLGPGSYTVTAAAPAGWVPTTPSAPGTNGANDSNASPASTTLPTWNSHDLTLDFGFVRAPGSGQGCTPGYWKQKQHFDSWKWYTQTDLLDVVFGLAAKPFRSTHKQNPSGALTLLGALELNGNGGGEQLFRHGTAALLNSVYQSGVSYPYTAPQVIQMVRDAWLSGNASKIEAAHTALGAANERECPLN